MGEADLLVLRRRFVLLTFLRWFPTGLIVPAQVLLLTGRGLSLSAIGAVMLVYGIVCLLLELPTGGLADVVGRRAVLLVSGVLFVASSLVLMVGQTFWVLAGAALLAGVARALDSGPLEAWYVDEARRSDPRGDLKPALSRSHAASSLGLGLGALVGGGLIAVAPLPDRGDALLLALSVPFAASAALGLVSFGMVLAWVRDHHRPKAGRATVRGSLADVGRTVARGSTLVTRSGTLRRLSARAVIGGLVLMTCELIGPLEFGESVGAGGYSVVVTLSFLAAALGSRLAPALARATRGTGRALVIATVVAGGLMAAVALPTWWAPIVAFVLLYAAIGLDTPLVGELLHEETTSTERSTVLSVQSLLLQCGGAAGNLMVPLWVGATSFDATWIGVGLVLTGSALLAVGLPQGVVDRMSPEAKSPPMVQP